MRFVFVLQLFFFIFSNSCREAQSHPATLVAAPDSGCAGISYRYMWMGAATYDLNNTLCARFNPSDGFVRANYSAGSFAFWLRGLPLLEEGTEVKLYNGDLKLNQGAQAAVIDIDVGKKDLQQCADAVMRLRAEYLFATRQYDKIAFNYTSGDRLDYKRWTEGRRIVVEGNKTREARTGRKLDMTDHKVFRQYMDNIFMYCGTLSLSREMKSIPLDSMQSGDVFIHGGSPGHAVIIVDMSVNPLTGEREFCCAQSYMPAQQPHILRNPLRGQNPWYPLKFGNRLITPEYEFGAEELKRF